MTPRKLLVVEGRDLSSNVASASVSAIQFIVLIYNRTELRGVVLGVEVDSHTGEVEVKVLL